ncbi:MAG: peptidase dimerization domain-containing protein, partial [Actinobacteria bacterium]|nr:peptidase dimerization domain-containing protein [Actinomycetota bacterium]
MTSEGSAYSRFKRCLATGNGALVRAAAAELAQLSLEDALAVCLVLRDREPEDVTVDGMLYREVFTPTTAWTSNARNVVPDAFTINVNYRFAPDKDLHEAEARIAELVAGRADIAVVDRAPAGRPFRDAPLVDAFLASVGARVEPKQ